MSKDLLNKIIEQVENRIDSVEINPNVWNVGEVFYLWDGIAKVSGLWEVAYNEIVNFDSWAKGIALNLEEHFVWVVVLSGFTWVKEWESWKTILTVNGSRAILPIGGKWSTLRQKKCWRCVRCL